MACVIAFPMEKVLLASASSSLTVTVAAEGINLPFKVAIAGQRRRWWLHSAVGTVRLQQAHMKHIMQLQVSWQLQV